MNVILRCRPARPTRAAVRLSCGPRGRPRRRQRRTGGDRPLPDGSLHGVRHVVSAAASRRSMVRPYCCRPADHRRREPAAVLRRQPLRRVPPGDLCYSAPRPTGRPASATPELRRCFAHHAPRHVGQAPQVPLLLGRDHVATGPGAGRAALPRSAGDRVRLGGRGPAGPVAGGEHRSRGPRRRTAVPGGSAAMYIPRRYSIRRPRSRHRRGRLSGRSAQVPG